MTEVAEAVQVTAARSRWRADLLAFDAAERERIAGEDPSPTARGIAAAAESKRAEATIHLDLAEAEERHSIAKQERDADPKDPGANRRYAAAAQDLVELRSYWRGIDEMVGNRSFVMALDDFAEPSDEEVLASHGGTN